ncbi:MAG: ABC transporter permease [Steroidobacteraceae bacterium]
MYSYYVRLAFKSFRRNPGLTALMLSAIALGIGVCIMTMTVYHAMSGNPIWWKNDRLYAVTMDNWDPTRPEDVQHPDLAPPQLTYKDAMYLLGSNIPERKVVMYARQSVLTGAPKQRKPIAVATRVTTSDFFPMFDVPFLYGNGWDSGADQGAAPVIVISKEQNEKLFGGINSVGRTIRWDDREFRIVGVLDHWSPIPRFYDLNNGAFSTPDDVYIPFGWTRVLGQYPNGGNSDCWKPEKLNTFEDYLASDCVWTQMWVELPNSATHERMQALLDGYWAEQRKTGRFQRPRNNHLTNVGQWLKDQGVVQNDNRMLVGIAFAFLAVCLLNTVGLLLAKFINAAAIAGVRRALGASRRQIFLQHLVEVGVLAATGAVLGLCLGALGLWGVHALYITNGAVGTAENSGGYQQLTHFDTSSIFWAVLLAMISALAAGLYPAWRVGRVAPAVYLKSQ